MNMEWSSEIDESSLFPASYLMDQFASCCLPITQRLAIRRDKLKPRMVPVKKRLEAATASSNSVKKPVERNVERVGKDSTKSTKPQDMDVDQEDATEGQFELNELMTRILEEELQTIMIEVWQAIPDDPSTDIERYVAEKLRNEVSDDLCNVLGLNVTKRLLNVYNPLFVKLRFSRRPESGCLTKFLDTYNIRSFKRLNKETNTFAAKLSSITDFDNICASREIRCGSAKITIMPCYKFTLCPKKLNTKFADKADESKNENDNKDLNEMNGEEESKLEENETKITVENKTEEKTKNSEPDKNLVINIKEEPATETNKIAPVKENVKSKETQVEIKKETLKPKNETQVTKIPVKVEETAKPKPIVKIEPLVAIKKETPKSTQVETQKNNSPVKIEENVKPKPIIKKEAQVVTAKQTLVETQQTGSATKFDESAKPKQILKKEPQVVTQKPVESVTPKTILKKEVKIVPQKINTKPIQKENKLSSKEVKITKRVDLKTEDLDDEMNDEEILALISSGVVVDECSGSDSE